LTPSTGAPRSVGKPVNGEIGGGGGGGDGESAPVDTGLDIGSGPIRRGAIARGPLEAAAPADTESADEDGVSGT
jgi:hypothetical protein